MNTNIDSEKFHIKERRTERECLFCGQKVTACMGFALARDFVNKRVPVREICGECVLMTDLSLLQKIDKEGLI